MIFFMLFLPQTYIEVKYILLFMSLGIIVFTFKLNNFISSKKFIFWFSSYIFFYIIWIFIGYIYGNPGIIDYFRLFVIWPFIYFILVFYINSTNIIYAIIKLLMIISFSISIYNLYKLLEVINIVPKLFYIDDGGGGVGIHTGFTQIVSLNIGSLVFLLPFVIGILIIKKDILQKMKINKLFLLVTVFVTILCSILSGRRVLWLILVISVSLTISFIIIHRQSWNVFRKLLVKSIIVISVIFILSNIFNDRLDINLSAMKSRFVEEFDPNNATPRNMQKIALIDGFYNYPIFGSGFGVGVPNVIRSQERPWTYELTYHLILYNTGLLGTFLFSLILLFPILWAILLIRKDKSLDNIVFPIVLSYFSVLIACATNPYLTSSFDFEWMLFLPLGIFNYLEINASKQKNQTQHLTKFS